MKRIRVGLVGLGTVGGSVARILRTTRKKTRQLEQIDLALSLASDLREESFRGLAIRESARTRNWKDITTSNSIDIVCELIGGQDTAYDIIRDALSSGKHVVTANKALLAERGAELFSLARKNSVILRFEAAVAGGIPILRSVREGLCANNINSVAGILNGTSNYILYAMEQNGIGFQQALSKAQKAGFAEQDPTLDVEGHDAAHKLCLLSGLAFNSLPPLKAIYTEGIASVGLQDVTYAKELGYIIKPLAIARKHRGEVELRVHPTLTPKEDVLASVQREYNAILVHGNSTGPTLYFGKGAGGFPTASSVAADVIDIARDIAGGSVERLDPMPEGNAVSVRRMSNVETRYYLRFDARDVPGVIGQVGTILARHKISIASVVQKEPFGVKRKRSPDTVPVVILVHRTKEERMQSALRGINRLNCVSGNIQLLRIEERGE